MDQQDEHVDNLIDAYALGALEPDEVARVERHLETCDACRALLDAVRAVTSDLLLAVPQAAPPSALRGRILSRIHDEAQPASQPSQQHAPASQTEATRPGRMSRLLRSLFGGETPELADGDADTLLRDLLLDPEVTIRPIAATEHASHASARFVGAPARHEGIVLAQGLRPLDAQHAYQVWLLRDGQPRPNNVFTVDHAGRGIGIVRADEAPLDFDVLAITPEPAGGSPGPTGDIMLAGALRSE
ncbi:MAG TPA: anti-sigma factor [Ktedonobacterales bacterium]|jgi:anti-sigma-K factor RskA